MIPSYAIIPTANRPQVALQAIQAILPQVDVVYVVDNGDNQMVPDHDDDLGIPYHIIKYDKQGQVPNLSLFWNIALDVIKMDAGRMGADQWDVAILNDDAIVPEGWFQAVSTAMRENNCAAGSSCGQGGMFSIHRTPGPVPLMTRMYGPAFVVAGEKGLRGDERLKWYYTDDYMDWESRKLGGMIQIPGYIVNHMHPNEQVTGEIQVQISNDTNMFKEIYGIMPW